MGAGCASGEEPEMDVVLRPIHERYDVAVIGAGPAGYVAAIRLSQQGKQVLLVERDRVGGVCLNWGCIPVKALLHAAGIRRAATEARSWGMVFAPPELDFIALYSWKARVVERLVRGIEYLLKSNRVETVRGTARFGDSRHLCILPPDGAEYEVEAESIIICTGSKPATLPGIVPDNQFVIDSNGALNLVELPGRIAVIGAGAIGLEFATVFSRLGSKVIVLELFDQVLPGMDQEVCAVLQRCMTREGIEFHLGANVESAEGGIVRFVENDVVQNVQADRVLLAVGRTPLTDELNLAAAGVETDARGFVKTDGRCRTVVPNICAIGDVRGGPLLAHKAMAEAMSLAEALGSGRPRRFRAMPSCVYTDPEVATIGLTETQARAEGRKVRVSRVPLTAVGRSLTLGRSEGLCKMVVDELSGKILGVTLLGPQAEVLIAEAGVAVELGLAANDLGRVVHPHPTMSELLFEAAEAACGRAVHLVSRP